METLRKVLATSQTTIQDSHHAGEVVASVLEPVLQRTHIHDGQRLDTHESEWLPYGDVGNLQGRMHGEMQRGPGDGGAYRVSVHLRQENTQIFSKGQQDIETSHQQIEELVLWRSLRWWVGEGGPIDLTRKHRQQCRSMRKERNCLAFRTHSGFGKRCGRKGSPTLLGNKL